MSTATKTAYDLVLTGENIPFNKFSAEAKKYFRKTMKTIELKPDLYKLFQEVIQTPDDGVPTKTLEDFIWKIFSNDGLDCIRYIISWGCLPTETWSKNLWIAQKPTSMKRKAFTPKKMLVKKRIKPAAPTSHKLLHRLLTSLDMDHVRLTNWRDKVGLRVSCPQLITEDLFIEASGKVEKLPGAAGKTDPHNKKEYILFNTQSRKKCNRSTEDDFNQLETTFKTSVNIEAFKTILDEKTYTRFEKMFQ